MLGLARRAGKTEIGEDAVGKASRAGKVFLILLAGDASDNAQKRAKSFGRIGSAPVLRLEENKSELGQNLGLTGPAMVGITDLGMAAALAERLGDGVEGGEDAAGMLRERVSSQKSYLQKQAGRKRQR